VAVPEPPGYGAGKAFDLVADDFLVRVFLKYFFYFFIFFIFLFIYLSIN